MRMVDRRCATKMEVRPWEGFGVRGCGRGEQIRAGVHVARMPANEMCM